MKRVLKENRTTKRIGALLIEAGLITNEQLSEALRLQKEDGGKIVEILIAQGYLKPKDFTGFLARQGVPSLDITQFEIPRELISLIPSTFAVRHRVVPIDRLGHHLTVGMECPLDSATIAELEQITKLRVKPVLCAVHDVRAAIDRYYKHQVTRDEPHYEYGTPVSEHDIAAKATPHIPESTPTAATPGVAPNAPVTGLASPIRLRNVSRLIRQLDSLPTLPDTVAKVQQAIASPNSGPRDIAAIIIRDPPIAAKLLSIVNSAAYGLPQKVKDIVLAISLIGMHEACSIVFSVAVINLMGGVKQIEYQRFWQRSFRCARIAKIIAQARGAQQSGGYFAAGLLHDIGQLALLTVAPEPASQYWGKVFGPDLIAAEEDRFGMNHTEAGYLLADHWELPDDITQSIRFHHAPELAFTSAETVATTTIADVLASADRVLIRQCGKAFQVLQSSPSLVSEVLRAGLGMFEAPPKPNA